MPHTATLPGLKRDDSLASHFAIGQGYVLHLPRGPRGKGYLYRHSTLLKEVDLSKKLQRQTLVVDLMRQGVNQSDLAKALDLSNSIVFGEEIGILVF